MRKSFLTQEFRNTPRPGTLTVLERRHFFGSKMMEIEDEVRVGGTTSFEHQLKKLCSTVPKLAADQSTSDIQNSAKWEMTIDVNRMLEEYLYNELIANNVNQDFTGLNEQNLPNKRLSDMVLDYVRKNLLTRYQFSKLVLWARYYDLSTTGPGEHKLLQYKPFYDQVAVPEQKELTALANPSAADIARLQDKKGVALQLQTQPDKKVKISYKQDKSALYYTYAYYFDVVFTKV